MSVSLDHATQSACDQPRSTTRARYAAGLTRNSTASVRVPATDDELVVLHQMAEVYRTLAHAAIHELAKVTRERDTARAATLALREEMRRYTARQAAPGRAA